MNSFAELSILISLAALLGLLANKLKQPPLLGYILAGLLINKLGIFTSSSASYENIELFSKIGITFLLFIIGLELNTRDIRKIGKSLLLAGLMQIIITFIFSFLTCILLGFNWITSSFFAFALTFSSTIVIVKLLNSSGQITSLSGKLSLGVLLLQDIVAVVVLILLTSMNSSAPETSMYLKLSLLAIKTPVLILILWLTSKYLLPWLVAQTRHDREVLFLLMIAWALFFATLVQSPIFGFSSEIGALLAGIALSSSKESLQIESWTRPLRDFFITIFFVLLGFNHSISNFQALLIPAFILSLFVLIMKPLIMLLILGILGYDKRTNFTTSISLSQISEFSLLLISVGVANFYLSKTVEADLITVIGATTMAISSYLIHYSNNIYNYFKDGLSIFEIHKHVTFNLTKDYLTNHIVIFGYHRTAEDLSSLLIEDKHKYLIVDHNPVIIDRLAAQGLKALYGDIHDIDLYDHLNLTKARLIISTVPSRSGNIKLLLFMKSQNIEVPTIVAAKSDEDARDMYKLGADYVVYPHLLAGRRVKALIEKNHDDLYKHMNMLARRETKLLEERLTNSI